MLLLYLGDISGNPPNRLCILWIFAVAKPGRTLGGYGLLGFSSPCSNLASPICLCSLDVWLQEGRCGGGFFPNTMSLSSMLSHIWPGGSRKLLGVLLFEVFFSWFFMFVAQTHASDYRLMPQRSSWRTGMCPGEKMLLLWRVTSTF